MNITTMALVFGITFSPLAANAQNENLTTRNGTAKSRYVSDIKNKTRDEKTDFRNLIVYMEKNGDTADLAEGFGHILGLSDERRPIKGLESESVAKNGVSGSREFAILYKKENAPENRIACYINRTKISGKESHSLWYLLSLEGDLEKAVVLDGRYDGTGKPIRGSGTPVDLDINSPAIRREFEIELSYWLHKAKSKTSH